MGMELKCILGVGKPSESASKSHTDQTHSWNNITQIRPFQLTVFADGGFAVFAGGRLVCIG